MQTLSDINNRDYLTVYGAQYYAPFLNGAQLYSKTILELFEAMPYKTIVPNTAQVLGSCIKIGTYSGGSALFNDVRTLCGLSNIGTGVITITKYEATRGSITYEIGSAIYHCMIFSNALGTCYKFIGTAV